MQRKGTEKIKGKGVALILSHSLLLSVSSGLFVVYAVLTQGGVTGDGGDLDPAAAFLGFRE